MCIPKAKLCNIDLVALLLLLIRIRGTTDAHRHTHTQDKQDTLEINGNEKNFFRIKAENVLCLVVDCRMLCGHSSSSSRFLSFSSRFSTMHSRVGSIWCGGFFQNSHIPIDCVRRRRCNAAFWTHDCAADMPPLDAKDEEWRRQKYWWWKQREEVVFISRHNAAHVHFNLNALNFCAAVQPRVFSFPYCCRLFLREHTHSHSHWHICQTNRLHFAATSCYFSAIIHYLFT